MKLPLLRTLTALLLLTGLVQDVKAQAINAGDLVFTGFNTYDDNTNGATQNDAFSFVMLHDCPANTVIYFTDLGWTGTHFQSLSCPPNKGAQTDGIIQWSSGGTLIHAGQQIVISCKYAPTATIGTVTTVNHTLNNVNAFVSLGLAGDQLFAFTGTIVAPVVIAGININRSSWNTTLNDCDFTSSKSVMPPATPVLQFPSIRAVNARYNCVSLAGSASYLRSKLENVSLWNKDNTFAFPVVTPFNLLKTPPCNLAIVNPSPQGVVYVNNQSPTPGDGSSWAKPLPELRDALNVAIDPANGVTQIWVAKGIYKPTAGTDPNASFVIPANISIYGGFAGNEASITARNIPANPVILSGDVGGDDAANILLNTSGINGTNSLHVVTVSNTVTNALLDGFIITAGQATGSTGGGLNTSSGHIKIFNTQFSGNYAANGGGAINTSGDIAITNSIFLGNRSGQQGGAIQNNNGVFVLTNVTITGNTSATAGAGLMSTAGTLTVNNSIISGNTGSGDVSFSTGTINHSILGNQFYTTTTTHQATPAVQFVNAATGNLRLTKNNFAINHGDPQTNNNGYTVQAGLLDLGGQPRISNTIIDLGAFEYQPIAQTITFPPIAPVIYGAPDIDPGATTTGDGPIVYSSANKNVGDTVAGKIKIKGVGTTVITANAPATNAYLPAAPQTQTLTVNKHPLQIKVNDVSRPYGKPNPAPTFTYTGFVYNEDSAKAITGVVAASFGANVNSPAGTYPITTDLSNTIAPNYALTAVNGTLTITKGTQIITFTPIGNKTYGNAPFTLNATSDAGLPVTFSILSGPATVSGNTVTITGAGNIVMAADQAGNANYTAAARVTQTITVAKATLTVTATNKTKAYLQPNPTLTYAITGFVNGDNNSVVNGAANISTLADINSTPGTYPITVTAGNLSAANYIFSVVNGSLTVTKATQTITFTPISGKTYGDAPFALNATSSSGLPVSFTVASGPATLNGDVLTITGAGNVTVTATQAGNANYSAATPVNVAFSIATAALTVKADNKQKQAGAINPPLTYTISGFVLSDNSGVVSGAPALNTTATTASPAGNYPITVAMGTLSATNYHFLLVNGTLTIGPATQIINFPAISTKTYGNAPFALNASSSSGLPVSYQVVSGPATISGNMVTITGVGTVTIAANQAGNSNYLPAAPVTQSFTVNKAVLTVKANNASKVYLQPNPALTYAITGFVNGDNNSVVNGAANISTLADINSTPGTYPITVTAGNLSAANYIFSFVNGSLTVTAATQTITFTSISGKTYGDAPFALNATSSSGLPVSLSVASGPATISGDMLTITGAGNVTVTATQAGNANYSAATPVNVAFSVATAALTVKADNKQKQAGAINPPLTYTISGFVLSDNSGAVSGAPVLNTTATTASPAGNYPITVAMGTLSATNYHFLLVNGTLTIGPATQIINFPAISTKTYGNAPFALNASSSSGLPVSYHVVSGPATISGNMVAITGVGTVTIAANQAGNSNYLPAAPVTQSFTVNKAVLTVKANNVSKVYLQPNPALTYTITGFVNGDNNSVVNGAANISTLADINSTPGTYPITVTAGNLSAANYIFSVVNGSLTVTRATQTINFNPISGKTYGDAPFALNATSSSGLPVSFTVASGPATVSGNMLTITGAGNVTVTATQAGNANYSAATPVNVPFAIATAALTVKADNKERPAGANNPPLTYIISGFVNGDNNSVVSGSPVLNTTANTSSPAGNYPITITAGTLSATNYHFVVGDGLLKVDLATQTITFPAIAAKTYGDAPFTLNASSSSGLPVTYHVVSGPAIISGNTVTLTGAGTVMISANQGGNGAYAPATSVTQSFTVNKAALTIKASNDTRTYTGNAYTGGNGVSYSGFVGSDNAAKLGGTLVYSGSSQGAINTGTYIITPGGFSSNDYLLTYTNGQLTITRASQQITFTAIGSKNQGDPDFTLIATSSSGLPITFSSDNATVISVNGQTAHVGNAGTVHISAAQAGNNNYDPATTITQTVTVTAFTAPVITAGGSTTFCEGNSVTLQASAAPGYEWYNNNVKIAGANSSSLTITESGIYTVKAIYSNNFSMLSAPITVTVHPLPDGNITVSGNTTISKGESIILTASGGNSYAWSPAAGLNDPGIAAPVARPAVTTTYQVIISSVFNCSVTKAITITVNEDFKLEATNILTPNGDGKNDLWVVKNIDMYPQNEVKIYDRAGRMVYEKRGYTNNWNGMVNGHPLAEGTYYYIITLGDNKPQFKGFITIIHHEN